MKKVFLVTGFTLLSGVTVFAQKDELKSLKKIYSRSEVSAKDVTEYKNLVQKLKPIASEEGDKIYAAFYEANTPMVEIIALGQTATPEAMVGLVSPKKISDFALAATAVLDYEKKLGKKVITDEILQRYQFAKPLILSYAVGLGEQKQFAGTSEILYAMYVLDKNDPEKLYFAANYAVNAKDYDTALKYYDELKRINYSGEGTAYFATNVANDREESFNSKADRDRFVALKTHVKPREEKIPSKRGEIYRNIALILVEKGKVEEAKTAIKDARAANPDDTSLIISEANLYLQTKDFATYKALVKESLAKDPNNKDLIFNLGVIAYNNKDLTEAENHYKRVIEIDPTYANAYLNLAILKLDGEKELVEKMNKLGNSDADNKKYEVLRKQREDMFKGAMPYLTKTVELQPDNIDAVSTLYNVYRTLDMETEAKAMKARLKALEGK
ncbi:tetratricopeptide repeat protein [Flavobacterium sp.]|uniref:tetratricopeptide repeat protein n=1 Tax=Flavobacterium sp. TaxID=239 RepID=UPI003B9D2715